MSETTRRRRRASNPLYKQGKGVMTTTLPAPWIDVIYDVAKQRGVAPSTLLREVIVAGWVQQQKGGRHGQN